MQECNLKVKNVDIEKSWAEFGKVDGKADEMVGDCVDLVRINVGKRGWMDLRVRTLMSV